MAHFIVNAAGGMFFVGFEVLMAVVVTGAVMWVIIPCSLKRA
jgi:hypothetical protein